MTSRGIDAPELLAESLLDPADVVLVEGDLSGSHHGVHGVRGRSPGSALRRGRARRRRPRGTAGWPRPKLPYTIPDFLNPSGRSLSVERRAALAALTRQYGLLVVEDVAYRELSVSRERRGQPEALPPDVVVHVRTFSKTVVPNVRVGWAAGPSALIGRRAEAKMNSDQCAGALAQRLVEEHLRRGHLDRQLVACRARYVHRCSTCSRRCAGRCHRLQLGHTGRHR